MKILIADDDPVSRRVLQAMLIKWEYDVVEAEDGDQAWRILQQENAPSLAIVDWIMPGMSGVELCRRIREVLKPIYIIILTTKGSKEDMIEGLQAGADDYVTKPFDNEELRARLRVGKRVIQLQSNLTEALKQSKRSTEEIRKELEVTQHKIVQEERLRALGKMASGTAHEVNNALSPIVGFSDLLLSRPVYLEDKKKASHYLKLINTAALDAADVVSRLREFYRPREKGEVFLPTELNKVVEEAVNLTQPKWKDQTLAMGITISIETDLSSVPFLAGNEAELREVLTNLIFNAVDAMPKGGKIKIRTYTDTDVAENESERDKSPDDCKNTTSRVMLEVRDVGVGMSEDVRRRCLEPFFSTKGEQGTGMGLSIVYGIIRRHEGSIEIDSTLNKGTTFRMGFPAQFHSQTKKYKKESEPTSRSFHVLVVDDEAAVRKLVTTYLADEGHTSDIATNGREGLEKFNDGHFDLIITDKGMPEMNGDQMAVAIKQIKPDIPIMMLSGFGSIRHDVKDKPPCVDYIASKPITFNKFRESLKYIGKIYNQQLHKEQ